MSKSYTERQAEWIAKYGVKVGSKVKVTRRAASFEGEWNGYWLDRMTDTVGRELEVIYCDGGIRLTNEYFYPYFVLEPVMETNMLTTEQQKQLDDLDAQRAELLAKFEAQNAKPKCRFEYGQKVWVLFPGGDINVYRYGVGVMERYASQGNIFATEAEAIRKRDFRSVETRLTDLARDINEADDFVADYGDGDQKKYQVFGWDYQVNKAVLENTVAYKLSEFVFKSAESRRHFINQAGDDLKLYFDLL